MTHLITRIRRLTVGSIGLLFAALISFSAEAQVVLDMPPPPMKRANAPLLLIAEPPAPAPAPVNGETTYEAAMAMTRMPATQTQANSSQQQEITVGDVALYRYSRARSGTYDTYFKDGLYRAGIRTYAYPRFFPQFVWGPWFFPFFHFSHHCW